MFAMKDLSAARNQIIETPDGISLSQSHYVDKIIERFKKHGIKGNTNLFHPHVHLRKNTGTEK